MIRALLVAALLLVAAPATAQTTIDFDDLAASSCVYASAPSLGAQYAAMGVTFSGNIENFPVIVPATCLTIGGASPPNIVGLSGAGDYLRADFAPSVGTVSFRVGNYNRIETFTLTAYDDGGAVLTMTTSTLPFRMFGTISVTASGIAAVVLTAAHSENAVDAVTFSSAVTVDAGVDAAVSVDAGGGDAATRDAAIGDAAVIDAAIADAAVIDAAIADAAVVDAAIADAAVVDAAVIDAAVEADASTPSDAGALDAGPLDAGGLDATAPPYVDRGIIIPGGCRCEAAGPREAGGSVALLLVLGVAVGVRGGRRRRGSLGRSSSGRP